MVSVTLLKVRIV
ncbi:hypothetical protein D046_0022A, partial [Vibrio parahaemolyticus V-223/04]